MRLLPDTHAFLWLLADDDRLSPKAGELLTDPAHEVLLSAAVVWEVAIKRSVGKLEAPDGFVALLMDTGTVALAISVEHAQAVESLPWKHRDPFERLLVAQATLEEAVVVSKDDALRDYGVRVAW